MYLAEKKKTLLWTLFCLVSSVYIYLYQIQVLPNMFSASGIGIWKQLMHAIVTDTMCHTTVKNIQFKQIYKSVRSLKYVILNFLVGKSTGQLWIKNVLPVQLIWMYSDFYPPLDCVCIFWQNKQTSITKGGRVEYMVEKLTLNSSPWVCDCLHVFPNVPPHVQKHAGGSAVINCVHNSIFMIF